MVCRLNIFGEVIVLDSCRGRAAQFYQATTETCNFTCYILLSVYWYLYRHVLKTRKQIRQAFVSFLLKPPSHVAKFLALSN